MLFGLGKNLRKCGIKTELIGERSKIIQFCQEDSNKDFIVLSTGKAYKQLDAMLGEERLLTCRSAVPTSMLVNHIMRELNIIIHPEDIYSRCMGCNKRGFVRFPMPVAIRLGAEWLDITQEDLQDAFIKLRSESALTVQITQGLHTGKEPSPELLPNDESYYLYEDRSHLMCETRHCAMRDGLDHQIVGATSKNGPFSFHVGLKIKKSTFEEPDLQFYVCTECGKMQYKSANGSIAE